MDLAKLDWEKIITTIINYYIEVFKYWGFISDEDVKEVTDFIEELK